MRDVRYKCIRVIEIEGTKEFVRATLEKSFLKMPDHSSVHFVDEGGSVAETSRVFQEMRLLNSLDEVPCELKPRVANERQAYLR